MKINSSELMPLKSSNITGRKDSIWCVYNRELGMEAAVWEINLAKQLLWKSSSCFCATAYMLLLCWEALLPILSQELCCLWMWALQFQFIKRNNKSSNMTLLCHPWLTYLYCIYKIRFELIGKNVLMFCISLAVCTILTVSSFEREAFPQTVHTEQKIFSFVQSFHP